MEEIKEVCAECKNGTFKVAFSEGRTKIHLECAECGGEHNE